MARHAPPRVVLLSALGTLGGIDDRLGRAGVRLTRIFSVAFHPVDPKLWSTRLESSFAPDTVIVTSRTAVQTGVIPWLEGKTARTGPLLYWAAGPGTAAALRAIGIRTPRRPRTAGAAGILRALHRGAPRRVLYFRSDRAGPGLARRLRQQGHAVTDLVVYRLDDPPALPTEARRALRGADLLVAASPSSLSGLRRQLDRRTFLRLRRTARLVVLGERSKRAAQGHGFRRVSVAPSTTAQGFTRYLLRELRDAAA
jgi:uroporphyrinogen-III synthase